MVVIIGTVSLCPFDPKTFCKNKMRKSRSTYDDDSCSLFRLPDEMILQIFNKIIVFKTLCICKLVSRRFYWIVRQVDTISFIAPLINPPHFNWNNSNAGVLKKLIWLLINGIVFKPLHFIRNMIVPLFPSFTGYIGYELIIYAKMSLTKFRFVKSLHIELPSLCHRGIDTRLLGKWKVNFSYRVESYVFLSPDSICDINTNGLLLNGNGNSVGQEEEDLELTVKKFQTALKCLWDATYRCRMLLDCAVDFPWLEKVSITDYAKRGTVSLSGGKIAKVRNWLHSYSPSDETLEQSLNFIDSPHRISLCHIPVLELPVSGYVMKRVTLFLMERDYLPDNGDASYIKTDFEVEEKEEAAYSEAVIEIFKKHRERMERFW